RLESRSSPPQGPLAMNRARLGLKGSRRCAVSLGSALLSLATGCAGPGHHAPDYASEQILPPALVALAPGPGAPEWADIKTDGAPDGKDDSTPRPPKDVQPSPSPTALPELPPPRESRDKTAAEGTPAGTTATSAVMCRPLALPEAIALAFQLQPR